MTNAEGAPPAGARGYLGVDGGGTKTHAVIVDESGHERGRGHAASANITAVGTETAVANILAAVHAAQQSAGHTAPLAGAWLGLAGIDRPEDAAALRPRLCAVATTLRLTNDGELVLGALERGQGVALIAGTGSIAFGRGIHGDPLRAGGWGHVMGDEGSGYDIGRRALRAVTRASDGRGRPTVLVERILAHWRLDRPDELIDYVHRTVGSAEIAALAPLVLRAARECDETAAEIAQSAADELALLAVTVGDGLGYRDAPVPLALGGSLLVRDTHFRQRVLAAVTARRQLGPVSCVEDAALAAARAVATASAHAG